MLRRVAGEAAIDGLRQRLTALLASEGIVAPGEPGRPGRGPAGGRADAHGLAPGPHVREVEPLLYRRLFAVPELHELAHRPELRSLCASLLGGGELFVHPRPACRVVPPASLAGAAGPTPPHQDLLGMQGTSSAIVCWVPLTDCPRPLGPIAVAPGSHLGGLRPYRPQPGARVLCCDDGDLATRFAATDLRAGDVVVFHALSVHRALPNRSDRVRMSVDFRCQPAAAPVCELTVRDDPAQPWDEVYAALEPGSPATAWRSLALRTVPFDASVLTAGAGASG